MTRLPTGRFTYGSTPATRQHGAPLLRIMEKSPPHCAGWVTRKANERARVWAVKERLDRELGR